MKVNVRKSVKETDLTRELEHTLETVRQIHASLTSACQNLTARIEATFTDATDAEMGLHVLWIKQVLDTLSELSDEVKEAKELNARRLFYVLVSRESDGFMAHDKKFRIDGDMLPKPPKQDTPQYQELLRWIQNSEWAELVKPKVEFNVLRKICNELAERGEPMPPHVKLSHKAKVRVY